MSKKVKSIQTEKGTGYIVQGQDCLLYKMHKDRDMSFPALPAGVYTLYGESESFLGVDTYVIKPMTIISDGIIDLPNKEFQETINQFNDFMSEKTIQKYKELNFVHKRSILLYGPPGTGKTTIVNKLCSEIVARGGIVMFTQHPGYAKWLDQYLHLDNKGVLLACVLEEFDSIIEMFESEALTLLDGQFQRDNTIFLCTTNYLDKIPKRIMRPGRINLKIKVDFPSHETRMVYVISKLGDSELVYDIVNRTEGFTIDEIREVIQQVAILNVPLDKVISEILATKVELEGLKPETPDYKIMLMDQKRY